MSTLNAPMTLYCAYTYKRGRHTTYCCQFTLQILLWHCIAIVRCCILWYRFYIFICRIQDLQHPNEFIRGSTLRFLCKLKESELLEPLMPAIRACLEHRHSYVRRNAVLAIYTIYRYRQLIPICDRILRPIYWWMTSSWWWFSSRVGTLNISSLTLQSWSMISLSMRKMPAVREMLSWCWFTPIRSVAHRSFLTVSATECLQTNMFPRSLTLNYAVVVCTSYRIELWITSAHVLTKFTHLVTFFSWSSWSWFTKWVQVSTSLIKALE